jgi:hypothetical protein
MRPKLVAFVATSVLTSSASAHGEEVLLSFYAQAVAVVAVLLCLGLITALREHWAAGTFGCLGGVVTSWLATARVPYMENRAIITVIGVLVPPFLAGLSVYVAHRYASRSRGA